MVKIVIYNYKVKKLKHCKHFFSHNLYWNWWVGRIKIYNFGKYSMVKCVWIQTYYDILHKHRVPWKLLWRGEWKKPFMNVIFIRFFFCLVNLHATPLVKWTICTVAPRAASLLPQLPPPVEFYPRADRLRTSYCYIRSYCYIPYKYSLCHGTIPLL